MYEDFKWLSVGWEDAVMVDVDEFEDLEQHKWHRDSSSGPKGVIYSYQRGSKKTLGQHLLRSRARGKMVMHKNGDRQDFRKANLEAVERGLSFIYGMQGDSEENLRAFYEQRGKQHSLSGAATRGGKTSATLRRKQAASSGKLAGVRPLPNDSGTPRYGVRMMVSPGIPGIKGKQKSFGSYATPEEAGRVYDWLLFQLGLEPVNFPDTLPPTPKNRDDANRFMVLLGLSQIPTFSWPVEEGVAV